MDQALIEKLLRYLFMTLVALDCHNRIGASKCKVHYMAEDCSVETYPLVQGW